MRLGIEPSVVVVVCVGGGGGGPAIRRHVPIGYLARRDRIACVSGNEGKECKYETIADYLKH
jgi:hypothetical protein